MSNDFIAGGIFVGALVFGAVKLWPKIKDRFKW